jgi:pimeloyl-ACP methyl ester carboxylesterase
MRTSFSSIWSAMTFATFVALGCTHRQPGSDMSAASALESRTIGVPRGGELYVESKGQGRPVVFIHGGQLDRRMWDREFDALADQYHVIRYDVRGFGRSPAGTDTSFRSSDDLAAVLDSLGLPRTSIVGLSLGGRIAIDFAIAHPERVDRLVLLAPGVSGFPWSPGDTAAGRAMDKAIEAGDTAAITELWLRTKFMTQAMANPAIAPRVRELSLANSGAFVRARMGRELEPPAWQRLRELRVPTLVVVGTSDDPDIITIVDSIAAQAPHARKLVIPGAGHMLNMERPAEILQAIRDFLRSRR